MGLILNSESGLPTICSEAPESMRSDMLPELTRAISILALLTEAEE